MLDVFQFLFMLYYFFFLYKLETLESVGGPAWCSYDEFLSSFLVLLYLYLLCRLKDLVAVIGPFQNDGA